MTREMGKVLAEARGDVQEGIDIAFLMAGEGRRMFGDTVPSELPDKWAMSIRQPIGVAGIITPWNFPMAIPCWKMMPALVTGNTVVFKPSSDTPHCATLLVELMAEAGFPPGVVNLVTRRGGEVGDAIVENPDVAVISFTGSSTTGSVIAERGRRLKRLSLELGGKNGVVVLADADLDLATDGILWSAFGTTGQRCTAGVAGHRRALRSPILLERLESRARAPAGLGLDQATDVGPLINAGAVDKVAAYVEIGRGRGRALTGGGRATDGDLANGHFFEPTIFAGVRPMDRIGQEEIFGPVLSVIPVADYGEAMMALNQTRYGLSSSIFTRDVNTAFRAMRDFETGIVYVNAGTTGAETHLPFGGWKETGNGHREAGHVALDTYTEWKSIYVDFSGRLQRAQIDLTATGVVEAIRGAARASCCTAGERRHRDPARAPGRPVWAKQTMAHGRSRRARSRRARTRGMSPGASSRRRPGIRHRTAPRSSSVRSPRRAARSSSPGRSKATSTRRRRRATPSRSSGRRGRGAASPSPRSTASSGSRPTRPAAGSRTRRSRSSTGCCPRSGRDLVGARSIGGPWRDGDRRHDRLPGDRSSVDRPGCALRGDVGSRLSPHRRRRSRGAGGHARGGHGRDLRDPRDSSGV